MTAVTHTIHLASMLEGIESRANSPVPDRVDEDLEPHAIDSRHHIFELLGGPVGLARCFGAISIGGQHGCRMSFNHVVDVELYRGNPQAVIVITAPCLVGLLQQTLRRSAPQ